MILQWPWISSKITWHTQSRVVSLILTALNMTPLNQVQHVRFASFEWLNATVRMLVEKDADVNALRGQYGNALYAASSGGHKEIARMLVEKGADVNAQGGECGNTLQAASWRGYEEIAQMLVEKGADVNVCRNFFIRHRRLSPQLSSESRRSQKKSSRFQVRLWRVAASSTILPPCLPVLHSPHSPHSPPQNGRHGRKWIGLAVDITIGSGVEAGPLQQRLFVVPYKE